MLKELKVIGLNEKSDHKYIFNPDLNLLTGKNGAGKTTILKLIWYLNGGDFIGLINEINFQEVHLSTEKGEISIKKEIVGKKKETTNFRVISNDKDFVINIDEIRHLDFRHPRHSRYLFEIRNMSRPSLFFPTFRRIEGGFLVDKGKFGEPYSSRNSLRESLSELSERLSTTTNKFISSISTDDLVTLLTKEYASVTEQMNTLQKRQSDSIIQKIKTRKKNEDAAVLSSIQKEIERLEQQREEYFKPFVVLTELITKIFQHKGIRFNQLNMGEINNAVSSDKLSAGEKQMLSFLCYNTFSKGHVILIDEPELSLHPDWQRLLVPVLLEQGNNNQFFMATHSPFIYSRYPDKEIIIENDKGDNII
jgi:predicted ATP-binding protein involved in virulence